MVYHMERKLQHERRSVSVWIDRPFHDAFTIFPASYIPVIVLAALYFVLDYSAFLLALSLARLILPTTPLRLSPAQHFQMSHFLTQHLLRLRCQTG